MNIKRIIIPLLLILFMASMVAFGAPVYVNVGPTTEFDGDIKILSEIMAEGTTVDGWETTIFFTDPTADRTITIPDFDVTAGTAIYLTVTDNENTNETNAILFTSGGALGGGVLGIESDGDYYYNPSDGSVHATLFYGDGSNLTGVGAAAATALTFTAKEENTSAMVKGQPVYISGAVGAAFPTIGLADCDDSTKIRIAGLAAEAITQNTTGLVRRAGLLTGVDTLGANAVNPNGEAWVAGDILYVDDTAGGLTNVKPTSGRIIKAAYTLYGSSNTDDLLVFPHENPVYIACASGEDIEFRMGDIAAVNKVIFEDYADNEVAFIDSDGKADFTSLTLDTALADAEIASAATWNAKAASGANTDITSILNAALYVGRDADNYLGFDVDNTLKIEINNVLHSIVSISDGAGNNDKLCTQGYADDAAAGGGANLALSNLVGVAINTSLISDAADVDDLGSATFEWLNLYLGTYGTVYFGVGQTENIAETALNELTITATTVAISGTLAMGANNITTTGYIGRDADNYLSWDTDNTLKIEINNVLHSIISITTGLADNNKLATQGYVDDQVAGANVNLSNLGAVAINTSLLSDAADTDSLGSVDKEWLNLYIGEAGKIYLRLDQSVNLQATGAGILTITAANGIVTSNALTVGGTLALAANSITMTGSIGVTGSRVTKLWATDLEVTNAIAGSITGTARGLVSVANGDITIQPNGTGNTIIYAPADVVTAVNAVHTMTIAEAGTVKVSAAGAAYTITLPTAAGHTGLRYHFIKTDANYTLITLDGNGAETFNYENSTSAPTLTYVRLNTYCAEVTIVSDGSNWQVIDEAMGQVPEFYAHLAADQENIVDETHTVLQCSTEVYDIGSNYNNGTYQFTVPVSGSYFCAIGMQMEPASLVVDRPYQISLRTTVPVYKMIVVAHAANTQDLAICGSKIFSFNKDDILETTVYHNADVNTVDVRGGLEYETFFQMKLISKD